MAGRAYSSVASRAAEPFAMRAFKMRDPLTGASAARPTAFDSGAAKTDLGMLNAHALLKTFARFSTLSSPSAPSL